MNKKGIITSGVLTTSLLTGAWGIGNMWSTDGTSINYEVNQGIVDTAAEKGMGISWPLYGEYTGSIPLQQQIAIVSSDEANLRSNLGEKFEGNIRVEYHFDFGKTEQDLRNNVQYYIGKYGKNIDGEIQKSLNSDYQDPIEKTVKARAQTIAGRILQEYSTDEFQIKSSEISRRIKEELQSKLISEGDNIIKIDGIDNSGVAPGAAAQDRIERIASERREGDRADIKVANQEKVIEGIKTEAAVTLVFMNALRDAGYSEETIVQMNCQRVAENADRSNIPFSPGCAGSEQFAAAINTEDYAKSFDVVKDIIDGKATIDAPAPAPAPAPAQ